jgi:hypothetical protein
MCYVLANIKLIVALLEYIKVLARIKSMVALVEYIMCLLVLCLHMANPLLELCDCCCYTWQIHYLKSTQSKM